MKKILITIFLLLTFLSFSQTKVPSLLDEVSAKAKSSKSIKAEFTYSMENKQAKLNESKSGSLLVSGDKYKLMLAGQQVFCDGKTIWTFIKESNEVQINTLEHNEEALTPSKLLSSYNTDYKSKPLRDKPNSDPNTESFELTPNNSKNFIKAILVVDKIKKQVKSFSLFDKNGNTFTYKVTKFQTDLPVTPADFTFEPANYPGVEIIDMR